MASSHCWCRASSGHEHGGLTCPFSPCPALRACVPGTSRSHGSPMLPGQRLSPLSVDTSGPAGCSLQPVAQPRPRHDSLWAGFGQVLTSTKSRWNLTLIEGLVVDPVGTGRTGHWAATAPCPVPPRRLNSVPRGPATHGHSNPLSQWFQTVQHALQTHGLPSSLAQSRAGQRKNMGAKWPGWWVLGSPQTSPSHRRSWFWTWGGQKEAASQASCPPLAGTAAAGQARPQSAWGGGAGDPSACGPAVELTMALPLIGGSSSAPH